MKSKQLNLIFATNNANKVSEVQGLIGDNINIQSLAQAEIDIDIPEPYDTLEENAHTKAKTIFDLTGTSCFSEDTGLFVETLQGQPGVHSARYAGEPANDKNNIEKLLHSLQGEGNRKAYFMTVICLVTAKETHYFTGKCEGEILALQVGEKGFGYDSIFCPIGSERSFGEMNKEEKSEYSHRRKAVEKLIEHLGMEDF